MLRLKLLTFIFVEFLLLGVGHCSKGVLIKNGDENVLVQPFGQDAFRVRAWLLDMPSNDNYSVILDPSLDDDEVVGGQYSDEIGPGDKYSITNGHASVNIDSGDLSFHRVGVNGSTSMVLQESLTNGPSRSYQQSSDESWFEATFSFETTDHASERVFGAGGDQDGNLNRKNTSLELVKKNTYNPIPTYMSDRGYLMFWNLPSYGKMDFSSSSTQFHSNQTHIVDYYVVVRPLGDYDGLLERYSAVTGRPPMMPDWAMGYWQSKLRYESQDEVMSLAQEFHDREIPVSMIVIDYYSWVNYGDWSLDPADWPDPAAMADEVKELTGAELMASVWPGVDNQSVNYDAMKAKGYFASSPDGSDIAGEFDGRELRLEDATNPGARSFLNLWLDEDEGGQVATGGDPFLDYYIGPGAEFGLLFPFFQQKAVADGQREAAGEPSLSLSRSSWAGSQRMASVVWSGDIGQDWDTFKQQIPSGLSMNMAGQYWWTVDIGGFNPTANFSGDNTNPQYQELYIRWFQWGTFLPVMRTHGQRPDNEPWSYGDENTPILTDYINLRYGMKQYLTELFSDAKDVGRAILRPLFMDFSISDPYTIENTEQLKGQYMFGPRVMVAPVTDDGVTTSKVYLPELPSDAPASEWTYWWTNATYDGGQWVEVPAPIEWIPLFRLGEV